MTENPHGTPQRYRAGRCRCEPCAAAWFEYRKAWALSKSSEETPHGTRNGYVNYECRCDDCTAVHHQATAAQRDRGQRETRATAGKSGQQWTGAELELVVTRTDLSLVQLGKMLGRTRTAVCSARQRAMRDPKWQKVAGVAS